jgi:hypothetical protein
MAEQTGWRWLYLSHFADLSTGSMDIFETFQGQTSLRGFQEL